jgi:hypothetical protein
MDDEKYLANDAFQTENDLDVLDNPPVQPEKPKRNLKLIFGIIAVVLCSCLTIGGVTIATGLNRVSSEKAPIEAVLDDFMQEMLAEDVDAAYALYSPRAQRQFPKTNLENLLEGNNYVLIEGYQSLTIGNLNIKAVVNTDPDVPQGTVAEVTGVISYENNFSGRFEAILEKVDGDWFLDGINITVPPDKLQE